MREFVKASQIAQAEAKKYFVESARGPQSPRQSGVIWWNLIDGWPQISDAVVDYFFEKKLAYFYLRASQRPVLVMAEEASGWTRRIMAINNSREHSALLVTVADIESGDILWMGPVAAGAGEATVVATLPIAVGRSRCLMMTWSAEGTAVSGANHYVEFDGALELHRYLGWLPQIAAAYGVSTEELWRE
jgi:beta-mannosidase